LVKRGANGAAYCAARAAANAARLDRCALRWRGAARSPQACARPHILWQRPAAARVQDTPALTRGPRSSLAPLYCYCLGVQTLPAGSPRRLAFLLPVKVALACHFWLRILNHFWFRIVNQFWQTFSTASKKPLPFLVRKS
jgi:hypothetical protein